MHKPIVAIFPFDLLSHYTRCIQLANVIRDRFEVLFCRSDRYEALLQESGYASFDCKSLDSGRVLAGAREFDFSWIETSVLEEVFWGQVKAIRNLRPAVVIGDTSPTLKMAAEATDTFYVSLTNGYMTRYYRHVRDLPQTHPARPLKAILPPWLYRKMVQIGEQLAFKGIHRPFRQIRRKYGLQPKTMYLDELEGDFNAICDLPAFFPQTDLPNNYRFIGPLYLDSTQPEPEALSFLDNPKKNLLVSVGSSGELEKITFLKEDAFSDFNIIVTGEQNGIMKADHIFARPFLNHSAILERIDLVICHGGNGMIYQALSFGVPLLCVPSIFEQEWNVNRIEELGLGARLKINEERLHTKMQILEWVNKKSTQAFRRSKEEIDVSVTQKNFKAVWEELRHHEKKETVRT